MRTDYYGENLKMLYIPCGYFTEDEKCGYYELAFVVNERWLTAWYKENCKDAIAEHISLEEWLENYYTDDDALAVYNDAYKDNAIYCEQKDWKDKAIFYEVWQEEIESGEREWDAIIRTESLWSAKKVFKKAKAYVLNDSKISNNPENIMQDFEDYENGEAALVYDDGPHFYGLYLTKREIELEVRGV